ncbi:MAG: Uncharacterized protein FD167_1714 [bacterium]|nr:MAG: Uncharacterized protein FD167_1714 [bacterium]
MRRLLLAALLTVIMATSFINAGQGGRISLSQLNPDGQPKNLKEGESHRYYVWRDDKGWHVRTTTRQTKRFFAGTVTSVGGKIKNYSTFQLENKDLIKVNPSRTQLLFDFGTNQKIDGFDFQSDASTLRFDLRVDGKRREDLVFVGFNGESPKNMPFELSTASSGTAAQIIIPFGEPKGMGSGSSKRFMLWRENDGMWHLRTTTARNQHQFSGEVTAEGGIISGVNAISTEKKDWVTAKDPKRVVFNLNTNGAIDGFDFRTTASSLKFSLFIDGETRSNLVYIGAQAANPPSIPFTLPTK